MLTRTIAPEGSLDGQGAADHDLPYTFSRLASVTAPLPFSTRQLARLLVLRGRVRAELGERPAGRSVRSADVGVRAGR